MACVALFFATSTSLNSQLIGEGSHLPASPPSSRRTKAENLRPPNDVDFFFIEGGGIQISNNGPYYKSGKEGLGLYALVFKSPNKTLTMPDLPSGAFCSPFL